MWQRVYPPPTNNKMLPYYNTLLWKCPAPHPRSSKEFLRFP